MPINNRNDNNKGRKIGFREKLQKSKRTVETHRFNLMRKMEVKNLIDLSKKASQYKLI